jgi:signal peptidase
VSTTVKTIRIVSKVFSYVLVATVVLLAVLLGGVRLFGLTPYAVLSGSMEPTYHVGSVIYVTDVDPTELDVGDPITYRLSDGTLVTHRIDRVLGEGTPGLSFLTKGDANEGADGTAISAAAIVGKPVFSVPLLGYVSAFVQRPGGWILLAVICACVWLLSFVADVLLPKSSEESPPPSDEPPISVSVEESPPTASAEESPPPSDEPPTSVSVEESPPTVSAEESLPLSDGPPASASAEEQAQGESQ